MIFRIKDVSFFLGRINEFVVFVVQFFVDSMYEVLSFKIVCLFYLVGFNEDGF